MPQLGRDFATYGDFPVAAGDRVPFVLSWAPSYEPEPPAIDAVNVMAETERFWREWISRCNCLGGHPEMVHRSLITLKALIYRRSGGIIAAPTTSLPEQLGGSRTGITGTAGCETQPLLCTRYSARDSSRRPAPSGIGYTGRSRAIPLNYRCCTGLTGDGGCLSGRPPG